MLKSCVGAGVRKGIDTVSVCRKQGRDCLYVGLYTSYLKSSSFLCSLFPIFLQSDLPQSSYFFLLEVWKLVQIQYIEPENVYICSKPCFFENSTCSPKSTTQRWMMGLISVSGGCCGSHVWCLWQDPFCKLSYTHNMLVINVDRRSFEPFCFL